MRSESLPRTAPMITHLGLCATHVEQEVGQGKKKLEKRMPQVTLSERAELSSRDAPLTQPISRIQLL